MRSFFVVVFCVFWYVRQPICDKTMLDKIGNTYTPGIKVCQEEKIVYFVA